jgi:hypoxanthine phosphoribosyltransferase
MYLSTSENLHVFVRLSDYFHAKVLKKVDESMKFHDFFVILQKILYNMTMSIVKIKDKTFKTSIPEAEILKKVQVVADRLNKDYEGKTPVFLAVLNGAFIFAADLMRMITVPSEISFVKYASYEGTSSTGSMKTLMGLNQDLAGRHVVIVEDIVDSGFTMAHMIEDLKKMNPASVEVCSLLVKPAIRANAVLYISCVNAINTSRNTRNTLLMLLNSSGNAPNTEESIQLAVNLAKANIYKKVRPLVKVSFLVQIASCRLANKTAFTTSATTP